LLQEAAERQALEGGGGFLELMAPKKRRYEDFLQKKDRLEHLMQAYHEAKAATQSIAAGVQSVQNWDVGSYPNNALAYCTVYK
jgi:hypothetical protein